MTHTRIRTTLFTTGDFPFSAGGFPKGERLWFALHTFSNEKVCAPRHERLNKLKMANEKWRYFLIREMKNDLKAGGYVIRPYVCVRFYKRVRITATPV